MKNSIPYVLLTILALGKIFAWWLLFYGSNLMDPELTLAGMFEPIHQFSYLIVSSILVAGIIFGSRSALIVLALTVPVNFAIFLFRGTSVYQAVWDPVVLGIFIAGIMVRKPSRWLPSLGANPAFHPTSGRDAAFRGWAWRARG